MPTNDNAKSVPDLQIIWREWPLEPGRTNCGHGVELHDNMVSAADGSLVAFVDGFAWLHGSSEAIVYYRKTHGLAESEFNELKVRVEKLLRNRRVPIGQVTKRIHAIPNC